MNRKRLSNHDEELMFRAGLARESGEAADLMKQTESPEAYHYIHDIAVALYHNEEARAFGCV